MSKGSENLKLIPCRCFRRYVKPLKTRNPESHTKTPKMSSDTPSQARRRGAGTRLGWSARTTSAASTARSRQRSASRRQALVAAYSFADRETPGKPACAASSRSPQRSSWPRISPRADLRPREIARVIVPRWELLWCAAQKSSQMGTAVCVLPRPPPPPNIHRRPGSMTGTFRRGFDASVHDHCRHLSLCLLTYRCLWDRFLVKA